MWHVVSIANFIYSSSSPPPLAAPSSAAILSNSAGCIYSKARSCCLAWSLLYSGYIPINQKQNKKQNHNKQFLIINNNRVERSA